MQDKNGRLIPINANVQIHQPTQAGVAEGFTDDGKVLVRVNGGLTHIDASLLEVVEVATAEPAKAEEPIPDDAA